tara:strand:+ start:316 stop:657 length:342 start_codon:yes stop_codon:yes gene_type:complete
MKKIKLSVAALLIAGMSYGQHMCNGNCWIVSKNDTVEVKTNLTLMKNGVFLSKDEVYNMIGIIEDMLQWFEEDENNGDYSGGSYEEQWGHVYFLTIMLENLEEIASRNAENWR